MDSVKKPRIYRCNGFWIADGTTGNDRDFYAACIWCGAQNRKIRRQREALEL